MAGYTKGADGSYSVNYEDERFQDVKNEQTQQTNQTNQIYDNMLNNSDQYYQNQIEATKEYEKTQTEIQQAQTDYAIQLLEQQKEQTQKDYTREQQGAYVDYMKQTKSNAQNMANGGLSNTGYSESSIVSMYNQYQNRVGTAKESLNNAIMNYNNGIQQAILANNEKLAEIAYNSLQTQNQLNQQAFEYKNTIILQKEQALQDINDRYYARYQDVLNQINSEIELQMELDRIDREYNMWLQEFRAEQEQWQKEFELQQRQINASIAEMNAQTSYYNAQRSALNNPSFTDGNTTGKTGSYEVSTPYYQGNLNPDAKNGTFSNGYQPNNVNGNKLSKTGDTIVFDTVTLSGERKSVEQNIWRTSDGKQYYWDGRYNKYIPISSSGGGKF